MTARWDGLVARVRGLSGRLLSRSDLSALSGSSTLDTLADRLAEHGFPAGGVAGDVTAANLELEVRRKAAERLRLIARWAAPHEARLRPLFEDEDRRSLRALVRGAVQGAPAEERLAGLVPTPELPERALEELARRSHPGGVATLLLAWGNAYGPGLAALTRVAGADLFALDLDIERTYARRSLAATVHGDRDLRRFVRRSIDLANLEAAVAAALGSGAAVEVPAWFLPGGHLGDARPFAAAVETGRAGEALGRLVGLFSGTPYRDALLRSGEDPGGAERSILRGRIEEEERATRERPLGLAPVLLYMLRSREESFELRRIIWRVALGAPRAEPARSA